MVINAARSARDSCPRRAEARLGEEMFINGYALITWKWALTHIAALPEINLKYCKRDTSIIERI